MARIFSGRDAPGQPQTDASAPGEQPFVDRTTARGGRMARSVRGLSRTFEALENPAFARYFWATFGFFFAMQMQQLLRGYLIYDLTRDPFSLGLINLTFAAPMLLLAPVAGVVADRIDRRTIIIVSQLCGLALTSVTTTLILMDRIEYWHLLTISLFSSSAMVFNMPARQAMVPGLVGPERLMNALALSSGTMNASRIVAPAMAGALVAPIGVGGAYIVTMCFNLLAVAVFVGIPAVQVVSRSRRSFLGDMADGLRYIGGNRMLALLIVVGMVPMLMAMPYQSLLPVFAKDVWKVGAVGLGLLQAVGGVGGLLGAAIAANMGNVRRRATVMTGSMLLFGLCIALFAMSPHIGPALVAMLVANVFSMVTMTLNNTLIQSSTPDAVRGRVMSLMMTSIGITPLGTLPAGLIAREYGVRVAVAGGAGLVVLFSIAVFLASATYRSLDKRLPSTVAYEEQGTPAGAT